MKCHSRQPLHIVLLPQFLNTGSCRTWRARGAGGPALLRLPGAPPPPGQAALPAAAHRHGRAAAPARAGRGVRAPPDWPQRGAPRKVPRAAAGAARRVPAEWAAEPASLRWVRRRRGRGAAKARRARARSRSILPPVDGAARDPGGFLSFPPPSALKRRGAGATRSRVCRGK